MLAMERLRFWKTFGPLHSEGSIFRIATECLGRNSVIFRRPTYLEGVLWLWHEGNWLPISFLESVKGGSWSVRLYYLSYCEVVIESAAENIKGHTKLLRNGFAMAFWERFVVSSRTSECIMCVWINSRISLRKITYRYFANSFSLNVAWPFPQPFQVFPNAGCFFFSKMGTCML